MVYYGARTRCLDCLGRNPTRTGEQGHPWPATRGQGHTWPATRGQGHTWPATRGQGHTWPATRGQGRPWPAALGQGHRWPPRTGSPMAGRPRTGSPMATLDRVTAGRPARGRPTTQAASARVPPSRHTSTTTPRCHLRPPGCTDHLQGPTGPHPPNFRDPRQAVLWGGGSAMTGAEGNSESHTKSVA